MDATQIGKKLVGNDEERAVSPVIGVILMASITVILAAVIAAFVPDIGDDMGSGTVDAAVSSDVDNSGSEVSLSVTSVDNVDYFVLRGNINDDYGEELDNSDGIELGDGFTSTGDTITLDDDYFESNSGSANVVAISGDDESTAGSFEWDFDD